MESRNWTWLVRNTLLASCVGYLFSAKVLEPILLPWGAAQPTDFESRPVVPKPDPENTSLMFSSGKLQKIVERVEDGAEPLLKKPETVVIAGDGTIFVLTETAKLMKLTDLETQTDGTTIFATVTEVADLGMGRPLGGKFDADGTLYVADALLGLIRVKDPENPTSKVELLASRVRLENGEWSQILFADDLTIGPKTGKIYFSDACNVAPDRINFHWDVLYASKIELARGIKTGRLLEYDPSTSQTRVLADSIFFANGVAIDKDETFVIVSETFQARSLKYYLKGPKRGQLEPVSQYYPGYPDGSDCNHVTGLCYAVVPTALPPVMSILYSLPHPLDMVLRTLLMCLHRSIAPKLKDYAAVVEIDPGNLNVEPTVVRILQDPNGEDLTSPTGVTAYGNKLYLGFLTNDYVAVYNLA